MSRDANVGPASDPYRRLLLDMAQERSAGALLRLIVDRLTALPDAALARIWLLESSDACPDHTACLHLVAWARREGIRGFAGQPLLHRGQVLGVLGVFLRARLDGELLIWLRMIADHAAAAIANARAFEEIERLRARLELENVYLRDEVKAA